MAGDILDKINGKFKGKDILSLDQFRRIDIQLLFSTTNKMKKLVKKKGGSNLLKGKIMSAIFYEPSSRTFGSFVSAMQRLGGGFIPLQGMTNSSVSKGESIGDTIRTFESYSDCIVMRHPQAGSLKIAADAASIPVVNAGDGGSSHPTQGLLDLFTIYDKFKKLNNLTVLASGDVLHSRTIHSLIHGLSLFPKNTVYLLSPKQLKLSRDEFTKYSKMGIKIFEIHNTKDIPKNTDVWYWNRIQKERFSNTKEAEKYTNQFILTTKLLSTYGNKNMIVMDPLPRVGEIELDVDSDPRSVYFRTQMRNGMYLRMALLSLVLGRKT